MMEVHGYLHYFFPIGYVYRKRTSMSVSNYIQGCKYLLEELDDVVFLFSESHRKYIHIDGGEAYIDSLTTQPLALEAHNVSVTEEDALDERYRFTHSVSFIIHGYADIGTLSDRYFVVLKSKTGNFYMLNPEFPCSVTYTYTLDSDGSETDFNLSTASNHPILPLHWTGEHSKACRYFNDSFDGLLLNEKDYTARNGTHISYSNDGFKKVVFLSGTGSYTEQFDGANLTSTLDFAISLDDYKRSWHYNLLEFLDNRYSAVIQTKNGHAIMGGFDFGFQPSFALNGESNEHSTISLHLVEMVNGTGLGGRYSDTQPDYSEDATAAWVYTDEHDGFMCTGDGLAQYLLQKEINFLGNPTGRYKALEGYEDMFPDLNITGTFTDAVYFQTDKCGDGGGGGMTGGTLTDEITVPRGQCRTYTFSAVCDWNITQVNSGLTITPMSGVANTIYYIEICNVIGGASKLYAVYKDGHESIIPCDDSPVLSSGDTSYGGSISSITSADIGTCITEIGDAAFRPEGIEQGGSTYFSSSLSSVTIPNTVTRIGNNAFEYNLNLKNISLPSGLTSIGEYTFHSTDFTAITIPNTVTSIGQHAFSMCRSLTEIDIPTGITRIEEETFSYCTKLSSVTIPNSVIYIGKKAFFEDDLLTSMMISNSATTIGEDAFFGCDGLTSVVIGGGILGESAFSTCSNLRNVTLGSVTSIGLRCFLKCSSLESVVIPNSVTNVGALAFMDCTSLTALTFTSLIPPTFGNDILYGSDNATIYVPCAALIAYKTALPLYESRIVGYGDGCEQESGDTSNYYKLYAEYEGGSSMTVSCDSGGYTLQAWEVNGSYPLSSMTNAVIGSCTQVIDRGAFRINFSDVMGYTPQAALTSVTISSTVREIGIEAFFGQGKIRTVTFEEGSLLESIGHSAFSNYKCVYEGCNPCYYWETGTSLTNIVFPNRLRTIGHHAFSKSKLATLNIPDSVETIGTEAFWDISTLRNVTIGTGITSIGSNCFVGSTGITSMIVLATTPPTLVGSTYDCRDSADEDFHTCYKYDLIFEGSYPIYVPAASLEAYKAAEGWNVYASRLRAIS